MYCLFEKTKIKEKEADDGRGFLKKSYMWLQFFRKLFSSRFYVDWCKKSLRKCSRRLMPPLLHLPTYLPTHPSIYLPTFVYFLPIIAQSVSVGCQTSRLGIARSLGRFTFVNVEYPREDLSTKKLPNYGGLNGSLDLSAPTILPPRVRFPRT